LVGPLTLRRCFWFPSRRKRALKDRFCQTWVVGTGLTVGTDHRHPRLDPRRTAPILPSPRPPIVIRAVVNLHPAIVPNCPPYHQNVRQSHFGDGWNGLNLVMDEEIVSLQDGQRCCVDLIDRHAKLLRLSVHPGDRLPSFL